MLNQGPNQEFNEIVSEFYRRNNISLDCEENYIKGFKRRFANFLSQISQENYSEIKEVILKCVKEDYLYYSSKVIEDYLRAFHSHLVDKLIDCGWDINDCLFSDILNKNTYKNNSSNMLTSDYLKFNNISNNYYEHFNKVIEIETKRDYFLQKSPNYEYYTDNIYEQEKKNETERLKRSLESKKLIVLIDDYTGTGSTIDDFLSCISDYISDGIVILIYCIHATDQAIFRIKNSFIQNKINGYIVSSDTSDKYFKNNTELEEKFRNFETDVVKPRRDKDILGFQETESVVTTYRNTPNNTLSMFWSENLEGPGWRPLFPRIDKSGKSPKNLSKWEKESRKVKWYLSSLPIQKQDIDKVMVLLYIKHSSERTSVVRDVDLDRILCYNNAVIQECLNQELMTESFELTDAGASSLDDRGLGNLTLDDVITAYNRDALKQESKSLFRY